MARHISPLLLLLLAACGSDTQPAPVASPPSTMPPVEIPPVTDSSITDRGADLDFSYSYPGAAAIIPALDDWMKQDAARRRKAAARAAAADRKAAAGKPFHRHSLQISWSTQANRPELLSLAAQIFSDTGGARPLASWQGLLWSRVTKTVVTPAALFTDPAASFAALTPAFCAALDAQRSLRRGRQPVPGNPAFTACPKLADEQIIPASPSTLGRITTLRVLIAPGTAGPDAEGGYEIRLVADAALMAALKPDYRPAFVAQ